MAENITYINISSASCETYSTPVLPPVSTSFYLSTGNSYLRASDYKQVEFSNVIQVSFADYSFVAFTTQALLTNPQDSNKRYLEKFGTSSTDSSATKLATGTSADWSTLPDTVTYGSTPYTTSTSSAGIGNLLLQVVKAISGLTTGNVPTFVNINYSHPATISYTGVYQTTGLTPTAGGDAGTIQSGGSSGLLPRFYLRKVPPGGLTSDFSNAETYYSSIGGVTPGETDVSTLQAVATTVTSNLAHQFVIKKYTVSGTAGTNSEVSALGVFSGSAVGNRITDLKLNWDGKSLTVTSTAFPSSVYLLDITNPSDKTVGVYTILRNIGNSQYIYWNGYNASNPSSSTTSMVLRNYWTNGVSSTELSLRTIFIWEDLTPLSPLNPPVGSKEDVYRWKTQDNKYIYYTKNANDDGGNLAIASSLQVILQSNLQPNEGWAVVYTESTINSNDGGFIAYVRNGKYIAVMDNNGNLPATANPAGINLTNAPYNSVVQAGSPGYRFRCIKCSGLGAGNLCIP
jgi:hypothetical protein